MLENVVSGATWNYLQRGITAANVRNEVIANNIANVNTPHFKKSDVIFEDLLAYELYGTDSNVELTMLIFHSNHFHSKLTRSFSRIKRGTCEPMTTTSISISKWHRSRRISFGTMQW